MSTETPATAKSTKRKVMNAGKGKTTLPLVMDVLIEHQTTWWKTGEMVRAVKPLHFARGLSLNKTESKSEPFQSLISGNFTIMRHFALVDDMNGNQSQVYRATTELYDFWKSRRSEKERTQAVNDLYLAWSRCGQSNNKKEVPASERIFHRDAKWLLEAMGLPYEILRERRRQIVGDPTSGNGPSDVQPHVSFPIVRDNNFDLAVKALKKVGGGRVVVEDNKFIIIVD